jgi:NAD(P)-dependent dehydrogenase (short-subunit alcohol dehydrogenase family)
MTGVAGKTIYITGAASGMGLIAGRMLALLGANIVVLDLNPAEAALHEIESARRSPDQRVTGYRINIADRDVVISTVGRAITEAGAPDILINMAGIGGAAELIDMKFEVFDRVIQINLYGSRNIVEAVLPSMLARGSGKIVLVGSMGGIVPVYGYTAYGASKFAVVGLAQCLRYELKPRGISVACFCPGEVETPGLAAERKTLPPASAALKKIGGTMPVEAAVAGLVKGIGRDEFMIIPGWKVKFTYWMHRLTPDWLWNAITDVIVARALRETEFAAVSQRKSGS